MYYLNQTNIGTPTGETQALQHTYTDKDVVWLSSISSAKGKQGFVDANQADLLTKERNAAPSFVLFDEDGKVGKQYNAKITPHMYIIDPNGNLKYAGAIDSIKSANPADIANATNYVSESMESRLTGKAVKSKLNKPYGCSIEYKS